MIYQILPKVKPVYLKKAGILCYDSQSTRDRLSPSGKLRLYQPWGTEDPLCSRCFASALLNPQKRVVVMRRSLRFYFALFFAKGTAMVLKLIGRKGTSMPGSWAIILCPDFLGRMPRPKTVVGITGTNGKTSVANMVEDVLEDWRLRLRLQPFRHQCKYRSCLRAHCKFHFFRQAEKRFGHLRAG